MSEAEKWVISAQIEGFAQLRMLCFTNFLTFLYALKLTFVCNWGGVLLSVGKTFIRGERRNRSITSLSS